MIEIIGELFNKKAQITKDGFVCCQGMVKYVNGVLKKCKCLHLSGSVGSGDTLIPHGLNALKITEVDGIICDNTGNWGVKEFNRVPTTSNGYTVSYDATNIKFTNIGASFQNQPYKIKIEYWID
jgi:hypothetical protein